MTLKNPLKRNPAHTKRASDSWWHKATLIAIGFILGRNIPAGYLKERLGELLDLAPGIAVWVVDNAVGIVAIGSLVLKWKASKNGKGKP